MTYSLPFTSARSSLLDNSQLQRSSRQYHGITRQASFMSWHGIPILANRVTPGWNWRRQTGFTDDASAEDDVTAWDAPLYQRLLTTETLYSEQEELR